MVSFSQLPAVKKDTIFGAARKNFVPFYFVTALDHSHLQEKLLNQHNLLRILCETVERLGETFIVFYVK